MFSFESWNNEDSNTHSSLNHGWSSCNVWRCWRQTQILIPGSAVLCLDALLFFDCYIAKCGSRPVNLTLAALIFGYKALSMCSTPKTRGFLFPQQNRILHTLQQRGDLLQEKNKFLIILGRETYVSTFAASSTATRPQFPGKIHEAKLATSKGLRLWRLKDSGEWCQAFDSWPNLFLFFQYVRLNYQAIVCLLPFGYLRVAMENRHF